MFLLGLLSIVQILLLPGILILSIVKITFKTTLQKLIYVLIFSLFSNYFVVLILSLLNIYSSASCYLFVVFEFFILIFRYKSLVIRSGNSNFSLTNLHEDFKSKPNSVRLYSFLSLLVLIFFLSISISNIGSIFNFGDDIASWNRWATEWALYKWPSKTWDYPQLLPANLSITYVMINSTQVQFFAKAIMPFFAVFNLLIFIDLGYSKNDNRYYLAAIFYGILAIIHHKQYFFTGYADIPLSFFSLSTFYFLVNHLNSTNEYEKYFLPLVAACASFSTKQPGGYMLILLLAWIFYDIFIINKNYLIFKKYKFLLSSFLLLVSTAWWYFYKLFQFYKGIEYPVINVLQNDSFYLYSNRYYRMIYAIVHFAPFLIFVFIPLIFSLKIEIINKLTLFLVIPWILIWSYFFGYDERALGLVIPYIALCTAFGFDKIFTNKFKFTIKNRLNLSRNLKINILSYLVLIGLFIFILFLIIPKLEILLYSNIASILNKSIDDYRVFQVYSLLLKISVSFFLLTLLWLILVYQKIKAKYLLLLLLAAIFFNFTYLKKEKLIAFQIEQEKLIQTPQLNILLYQFFSKNKLNGSIGNNYGGLQFLPELKNHNDFISESTNIDMVKKLYSNPKNEYLLLFFDSKSDSVTKMELLKPCFELEINYENAYKLYKIKR